MTARASLIAIAFAVSAVHCSSEEASNPTVATTTTDELSIDRAVRVTRVDPTCRDVACAYTLETLTPSESTTPFASVAKLDLQELDPEGTIAAALAAADDRDIVVRGHMVSPVAVSGTTPGTTSGDGKPTFAVMEAYLGLPGRSVLEGDTFVRADERADASDEDALDLRATRMFRRLDEGNDTTKARLRVDYALATAVDATWVRSRVLAHGAIVAGRTVTTDDGVVLEAHQVFVRLPEVEGPCRVFKVRACEEGSTLAYDRRPSRCLVPVGCVTEATGTTCSRAAPTCEVGYSLRTWTAAPDGCAAYACDPTFATEGEDVEPWM